MVRKSSLFEGSPGNLGIRLKLWHKILTVKYFWQNHSFYQILKRVGVVKYANVRIAQEFVKSVGVCLNLRVFLSVNLLNAQEFSLLTINNS